MRALPKHYGPFWCVLLMWAPTNVLRAQADTASPLGCWAFELGDGQTAVGRIIHTPPLARLSADKARFTGDSLVQRFDADGNFLDMRKRQDLSHWRRITEGDSISVNFTLGLASGHYVLALPPRSDPQGTDTLFGRTFEWSDFGPTLTPRGPARAIRRTCPTAPQPPTASKSAAHSR